jgi:hypothetical protein
MIKQNKLAFAFAFAIALATSDLRLSVLLAEDSAGGCAMPACSASDHMVHGGTRAQLDPAHAQ